MESCDIVSQLLLSLKREGGKSLMVRVVVTVGDEVREINSQEGLPIELKVGVPQDVGLSVMSNDGCYKVLDDDLEQQFYLAGYTTVIKNTVLGVANLVSNIKGVEIQTPLGKIRSSKGSVTWDFLYTNTNVVVYTISYIDTAIRYHDAFLMGVGKKVTNVDLLENDNMRKDLIHMMTILSQIGYRYNFIWDDVKGTLGIVDTLAEDVSGRKYSLEDLDNEELFSDFDSNFLKFAYATLGFARSFGVFFIDAQGFNVSELDTYLELIRAYYGEQEALVFLTGIGKDNAVLRNVMYLPKLK